MIGRLSLIASLPISTSEQILQRELHNSGIPRFGNFPEKVAVDIEGGVHHDEFVENVERLRAEFHFLRFTHLKSPHDSGWSAVPVLKAIVRFWFKESKYVALAKSTVDANRESI